MKKNDFNRTEIINLVIQNNIEKLKTIPNIKDTINHLDNNGWSALHFAAQNQNSELIQFLINNGAKIDAVDNNGNTPLFRAVFNYRDSGNAIEILLNAGADEDIFNLHGISPKELAFSIKNYKPSVFFN